MICYLDRTFCISPECKNECGRKLTAEIREAAQKWWSSFRCTGGAPIAVGYFCGPVPADNPYGLKAKRVP